MKRRERRAPAAFLDEGGVALAAIQGLNQKVDDLTTQLNQRNAESVALKDQNISLAARLDELAAVVKQRVARKCG
jgi:NADH:ubiquinone oxidoreductase subunit D